MIRLATRTRQQPDRVIQVAVAFFGPAGLGLEVKDRAERCATFEGGGGFVAVEAAVPETASATDVVVDAREWEHDARRFVASL
jgi:hypothetical protein